MTGTCDFCGEAGGLFVEDHDHETGRIRGTVHPKCNQRIGPYTKANVQQLIDYLSRDADLGLYENRHTIRLTPQDQDALARIMERHPELRTRTEAVSYALRCAQRAMQDGSWWKRGVA